MRLNYSPTPKQKPFIDDYSNRALLFLAGRGSGKTFASAVKALRWACVPNSKGMIVGRNYKQLTVARDMLWDLANKFDTNTKEKQLLTAKKRNSTLPSILRAYNKQEGVIETVFNSTIYLRSGDNEDSLRGYSLDWFWLDEPALMSKGVLDNLKLSLRNKVRNAPIDGQYWLSTTPKGFTNWLYDEIPNLTVYKSTTFDNPYLPESFIESLPTDGPWYEQEINAEFVVMSGLVFNSTDYEVKELGAEIEFSYLAGGIDWGYTHPASVIHIAQLEYSPNTVYVYRELYSPGLTLDDIYKSLQYSNFYNTTSGKFKGYYADPSLPGNIEDLRRKGLLVHRANNDIIYGIDRVKRSKVIIHPNCENLIRELRTYSWNESGKPNKINDDAIDAFRYALVGLMDNSIADTRRVSFNDNDNALYNRLNKGRVNEQYTRYTER